LSSTKDKEIFCVFCSLPDSAPHMPRTILTSTDSYRAFKELDHMPLPLRFACHYPHLGYEPGWSHVCHFAAVEITPRRSSQISVYLALNSILHTWTICTLYWDILQQL